MRQRLMWLEAENWHQAQKKQSTQLHMIKWVFDCILICIIEKNVFCCGFLILWFRVDSRFKRLSRLARGIAGSDVAWHRQLHQWRYSCKDPLGGRGAFYKNFWWRWVWKVFVISVATIQQGRLQRHGEKRWLWVLHMARLKWGTWSIDGKLPTPFSSTEAKTRVCNHRIVG